jgi:hypothetical protein
MGKNALRGVSNLRATKLHWGDSQIEVPAVILAATVFLIHSFALSLISPLSLPPSLVLSIPFSNWVSFWHPNLLEGISTNVKLAMFHHHLVSSRVLITQHGLCANVQHDIGKKKKMEKHTLKKFPINVEN